VPWPTYSERFIISSVKDQLVTYHVPEDQRAVIKSYGCVNATNVAVAFWLVVHGYNIAFLEIPALETFTVPSLHLPVYERESISMQISGGGVGTSFWCAGYIFTDNGPGDPPPIEVRDRPEPLPAGALREH